MKLLFFLVISVVIFSCSNPINSTNLEKEIIGNWKLIKTITFWPDYNEIIWEDSVDVKTLYFSSNKVEVNIPNQPNQVCTWQLNKDSIRICNELYFMLLDNDTLLLSQAHTDGTSEYFMKNNK